MISRRIGERIVIGDSVEVTVTEIHRRSVRLAIKSSPGHLVLRGEVRDAIESANKAAALALLDARALESLAHLEAPGLHAAPGPFDIVEMANRTDTTDIDDLTDIPGHDAPASAAPAREANELAK